jgi:hypothetical protein
MLHFTYYMLPHPPQLRRGSLSVHARHENPNAIPPPDYQQGLIVLFCMLNRTKCILLVSVMLGVARCRPPPACLSVHQQVSRSAPPPALAQLCVELRIYDKKIH